VAGVKLERKFFVFFVVSMILPAALIMIAHAQPYYDFPHQIIIGTGPASAPSSEGAQAPLRFIVDVSGPVRFHLIYGILVGFLSGIMFAVSILYSRRHLIVPAK
jgi:hypothetical protein